MVTNRFVHSSRMMDKRWLDITEPGSSRIVIITSSICSNYTIQMFAADRN